MNLRYTRRWGVHGRHLQRAARGSLLRLKRCWVTGSLATILWLIALRNAKLNVGF